MGTTATSPPAPLQTGEGRKTTVAGFGLLAWQLLYSPLQSGEGPGVRLLLTSTKLRQRAVRALCERCARACCADAK